MVTMCGTQGVYGREVLCPFGVSEVDDTIPCEDLTITSVARWHHTVKHVYASFDTFEDVHRSADSHEIAWAVCWENLIDNLNHFIHLLGWFAYSKSTDGITFCVTFCHKLCTFSAQFWVNTTLNDGEKCLVMTILVLCF